LPPRFRGGSLAYGAAQFFSRLVLAPSLISPGSFMKQVQVPSGWPRPSRQSALAVSSFILGVVVLLGWGVTCTCWCKVLRHWRPDGTRLRAFGSSPPAGWVFSEFFSAVPSMAMAASGPSGLFGLFVLIRSFFNLVSESSGFYPLVRFPDRRPPRRKPLR